MKAPTPRKLVIPAKGIQDFTVQLKKQIHRMEDSFRTQVQSELTSLQTRRKK